MSFYDYPEKYVDLDHFRLPNSYFFTGRFYHEKGIDAVLKFAVDNPMITVYTLGFGLPEYIERMKNVGNIVILGTRPEKRKDIVKYMNMFENFLSFPEWEDTGPISVVEAELCGMNLVINENNKIRTNGWKDAGECREMIDKARDKIFRKVGEYDKS